MLIYKIPKKLTPLSANTLLYRTQFSIDKETKDYVLFLKIYLHMLIAGNYYTRKNLLLGSMIFISNILFNVRTFLTQN